MLPTFEQETPVTKILGSLEVSYPENFIKLIRWTKDSDELAEIFDRRLVEEVKQLNQKLAKERRKKLNEEYRIKCIGILRSLINYQKQPKEKS